MRQRLVQLIERVWPTPRYFLVECGKDEHPGSAFKVLYRGKTVSDLLHNIQDAKDENFYVYLSWVASDHKYRHEEYAHLKDMCKLRGFVPEVCDVTDKLHRASYNRKWEVSFPYELWAQDGDMLLKVQGFTEMIMEDVAEFIKENGLEYEDCAKEGE